MFTTADAVSSGCAGSAQHGWSVDLRLSASVPVVCAGDGARSAESTDVARLGLVCWCGREACAGNLPAGVCCAAAGAVGRAHGFGVGKGYFEVQVPRARRAYQQSVRICESCQPEAGRLSGRASDWRASPRCGAHSDGHRKKAGVDTQAEEKRLTGFSVRDAGDGPWRLLLDGDGRFLLGDGTVTHNTEIAMALIQAAADKGSRVSFIADRRSLVQQTSQRFTKPPASRTESSWATTPWAPSSRCASSRPRRSSRAGCGRTRTCS